MKLKRGLNIIIEYYYKHRWLAKITDGDVTGWVCEPADDLNDFWRNGVRNIIGNEDDARRIADEEYEEYREYEGWQE